jgi:hypothetical protein
MDFGIGGLNKFIHIWPYKSIDERNQVRDRSESGWRSGRPRVVEKIRTARLRDGRAGKQNLNAVGVLAYPINTKR